MVPIAFDRLVRVINSTSVLAKHLNDNGFPEFKPSTIYFWYNSEYPHPQKKYFKALKKIGKLYGMELTEHELIGK